MKNKELEKLNFEELIRYKIGVPEPKKKYDKPLAWEKLCTRCEDKKKVDKTAVYLEQISHGCDTSDYEHILGVLPEPATGYIHEPIMFVAESPGGNLNDNCVDENLKKIEENIEHRKYPPNLTYYWSPDPQKGWPEDFTNLSYMAGCYFAYLMRRYGFKNVYITNAVKCSMRTGNTNFVPYKKFHRSKSFDNCPADTIARYCVDEYLMRELDIFKPKLIFSIGGAACKIVQYALGEKGSKHFDPRHKVLYHYSARRSRKTIVEENNKRIEAKLREFCLWK